MFVWINRGNILSITYLQPYFLQPYDSYAGGSITTDFILSKPRHPAANIE